MTNLAVSLFLFLNPKLIVQFRFILTWAEAEGLLTNGWSYYVLVAVCTVIDFWSLILHVTTITIVIIVHMLFLETWTDSMTKLQETW